MGSNWKSVGIMGKKSVSTGGANYYTNPIDNYRKQLGRNEVHKGRPKSVAKLSRRQRSHLSTREAIAAGVKNWRAIIIFILLFLGIITLVYFLLILQTGALFLGHSPSTSGT